VEIMGSPEPISIARDVAIIVLCAETIVALLIVIFIAWKVYQLVSLAKNKAEELSALGRVLLENASQTAHTAGEAATTVKGSAEFISDTVVNPVVQVVSAVSGARSFVGALFGLSSSRRNGGRP
jgi:K+ transporter